MPVIFTDLRNKIFIDSKYRIFLQHPFHFLLFKRSESTLFYSFFLFTENYSLFYSKSIFFHQIPLLEKSISYHPQVPSVFSSLTAFIPFSALCNGQKVFQFQQLSLPFQAPSFDIFAFFLENRQLSIIFCLRSSLKLEKLFFFFPQSLEFISQLVVFSAQKFDSDIAVTDCRNGTIDCSLGC